MRLPTDRWVVALVAIVTVVSIALTARALDRLEPLTGDEPFYVMTAISIVRDGDFDESNNYANRDYDEFYPDDPLPNSWNGWPAFPRTLPPHPATTELGGLHTKHGLGLSLLIAIPYELAGRIGAVILIQICAILVAVNMFLLARDAQASPRWAATITIILAISMPIAPYSTLIFPEIPAALLLVYSIRRLAGPDNAHTQWMLTGAAIGFLPWLHQRFAPTAVVLVCVVLTRLWKTRDVAQAALALVPIAIGGFTLVAYNLWLYDRPIQDTADHAGFNGFAGTVNAGFGLLLDAQWGLLIASPVYLLALAGIPLWFRVSVVARLALIALAPYVVVIASYRVWWGEWGPPARYLVPIAPFAAGALAIVVNRLAGPGRVAVIVLAGAGIALMLVGSINPQRFYHHPNGVNNLYTTIDGRLGTSFANQLVAFQPLALAPRHERAAMALVLLGLLIALLLVVIPKTMSQGTRERETRPVD